MVGCSSLFWTCQWVAVATCNLRCAGYSRDRRVGDALAQRAAEIERRVGVLRGIDRGTERLARSQRREPCVLARAISG